MELKLSEILDNNETIRIDSNYFNKQSVYYDELLKNKPHFYLDNVVSGPFGSTLKSHSYLSEGIPFIRVENLKDRFTIRKDNLVYISDENNLILKNSQLFVNDLVMSKVGNTIGFISRIDEEMKTCNISENNLGIKLRNFTDNEKIYILVFLNSLYAQNLILRRISGNAQPKLNVSDMQKIPIPIFSTILKTKIADVVKLSNQKLKYSRILYEKSENILLKELGLLDFKPTKEKISIKSFSESFRISGRLDSEYYQPKYEEIISKIKNYKCGFDTLQKLCNLKDKNYKVKEDKYYKYIELSNIGTTGEITDFTYGLGKDLPTRARRIVKENDIIVSSIEGSLEKIALVTKELTGSLCSTGFYVINSDEINSETLLILFKNKIMQQILKKDCSGTILTSINKDEFSNIVIPIVSHHIQSEIKEKIKESFYLREQSKQLLRIAKKSVEIAIEKNEEIAIEWITEEVDKI